MGKVGIVTYGAALPKRRMKVEQVLDVWKNNPVPYVKNSMGVSERTVLFADEDTNTLAVASIRAAARRYPKTTETEGLFVGTCTNEYNSRPSATMIMEAANLQVTIKNADVQWSTKSGSAAIDIAAAMVASGMCKTALAVGVDTINRRTAPGDLTEAYASAGSVAVLLGKEDVIAEIDASVSYSEDLSDSFRVDGERYIRSGMRLGGAKDELGLLRHMEGSVRALMEKTGTSPEDYDYFIPQQATTGYAHMAAERLGFSEDQIRKSVVSREIGDSGSASALLGLANVLDQAKPGERILLATYGFGAGSDAISLTVTDQIVGMQSRGERIQDLIADKMYVDYGTAVKYEYKYIRPDYALGAFL